MAARGLIRFVAPALLFAGTVVLPAFHQAFHGRDHDHAGGGIRFHRHEPAKTHRHGDGPRHTHEAPGAPADSQESDPRHGDGSLAHYALALGEASPPPPALLSRPLDSAPAHARRSDPVPRPGFLRSPSSRGPPVSPLV